MRKKISHLLAISLMLFASSCSKDDSSPDNPNNLDPTEKFDVSQLFGNWYEETMNEEMRINQNGTFYDRYSNVRRCAEIEGQWECNPQKEQLAFRYFFMGQVQESTWTIKSINQDAITVALDFGQFKYERIDHTFTLKPGETATINLSMANFTSQNSRIVSVTQDASGCILTAEGEKGTTYVKVNPVRDDPYWIKVIVSDDCPDLWWDYVSLIGLNQQETQKKLNALGSPITGDDGYSFGYSTGTLQDVIKEVDIFLCKEEEIVTEIGLALKESVPENTINTYLNAHYYEMVKNGSFSFYSTTKDPETSKAIIAYDKDNKAVWIFETEHFLHNPHNDILGNYYEDLGLTTKEIIEKYGNPASQNENILIYILSVLNTLIMPDSILTSILINVYYLQYL